MLTLQNYRYIPWDLECFPSQIAAELDRPMKNIRCKGKLKGIALFN